MARAPLQKVQTGEKLHVKAGDWNAFIDAAVAEMNRRNSQKQVPHRQPKSSGIVRVRNDSGADLARFGVLGVSGVFYDPSLYLGSFKFEGVNLVGTTPAAADHTGRFVIVLEPIPAGEIGFALVSGVCQVRVDVTNAGHGFADVKDGYATKLASGTSGSAQILWQEAGTGTKWALVRLGPSRGAEDGFWAEITGYAEADSPAQNRWTYSWKEKVKTSTGYGGWTDRSGGRSGTNNAYNSIEDMNDGVLIEGNGVDIDWRWFGEEYLPCPVGDIVWMRPVTVGSATEYWFNFENEIVGGYDETCL